MAQSGQKSRVRNDKTTMKSMLIGFVLICCCCGVMHYILVSKGNLYLERSKPRYALDKKDTTGEMKEGVGVVRGEVSAASYDKFFLKLPNGKLQPILTGELKTPSAGSVISVTYAGGSPPKALMIEDVPTTNGEAPTER
jgi:hypothetical protein